MPSEVFLTLLLKGIKITSKMNLKTIFVTSILALAIYQETAAQQRVSASEIESWCHYLASDSMKGRANGSPEMERAAKWIASRFSEAGLSHLPGNDSFVDSYEFTSRRGGVIKERNVAGFIPGNHPDMKKEFILFTAHFDHVGIGRAVDGDSIYNGANDNAAGTATLIGLAHALSRSGTRLNRSVIFLAVSGEEMGMRGSRHFIQHPPVDPGAIFFNLNFEMAGHCTMLGPNRFYLTGAGFTNLDDLIDEYSQTSRWQRVDTDRSADDLFFASDNISFAVIREGDQVKLNIPAHTICTHGGEDHIHRPHDEPNRMDYKNMASLVNYLLGLTVHLDMLSKDAIMWDHESFEKYRTGRQRR